MAIEVRLAAGEYDGMDEAAVADLLTSRLNETCADKHLRVRTMPPRAARPEPGEPAGQRPAPRERRRPLPHARWRASRALPLRAPGMPLAPLRQPLADLPGRL